MNVQLPQQFLAPDRTTWHITLGTYGTRLHGGDRPTVDREHNHRGEIFIARNAEREKFERDAMRTSAIVLPIEVRSFIEQSIPSLCIRGNWTYRTCAAPAEEDHVHILLDAERQIHGKDVRKWLKRWLTEALNSKFGKPPGGDWWAQCGSTKPVKHIEYLNNAFPYICNQRTTPWRAGACRPDAPDASDSTHT